METIYIADLENIGMTTEEVKQLAKTPRNKLKEALQINVLQYVWRRETRRRRQISWGKIMTFPKPKRDDDDDDHGDSGDHFNENMAILDVY